MDIPLPYQIDGQLWSFCWFNSLPTTIGTDSKNTFSQALETFYTMPRNPSRPSYDAPHRGTQREMSSINAPVFAQNRARPQYHEHTSSLTNKMDSFAVVLQASSQGIPGGPQENGLDFLPDNPTKCVEYQRFAGSQASNSPQSARHIGDRHLRARILKKKGKSFACSKCDHVSSQKCHLKIHERKHTGEQPYTCHLCGKKATQKGNLEIHIRAHKDDRIFKCEFPECDAGFCHKSNLTAHEKIHMRGRATFFCKLEGCTKSFSSTGNRKAHHNKFHEAEFARLSLLIDKYNRTGGCPEQDKALVEDLAIIYKNSNKGIKGRGKGVKVERIDELPS